MSDSYRSDELEQFLLAVDRHLTLPAEIVLVGGTALALAYRSNKTTHDIDVYSVIEVHLKNAILRAQLETGWNVPFTYTGVVDAPSHYKQRLMIHSLPGAHNLRIKVPEKHDLALMKLGRGDQPDIDAVVELNERVGLDCDLMIQRYLVEMGDHVGSVWKRDMAFLSAIEAMFGDDKARAAEQQMVKADPPATP